MDKLEILLDGLNKSSLFYDRCKIAELLPKQFWIKIQEYVWCRGWSLHSSFKHFPDWPIIEKNVYLEYGLTKIFDYSVEPIGQHESIIKKNDAQTEEQEAPLFIFGNLSDEQFLNATGGQQNINLNDVHQEFDFYLVETGEVYSGLAIKPDEIQEVKKNIKEVKFLHHSSDNGLSAVVRNGTPEIFSSFPDYYILAYRHPITILLNRAKINNGDGNTVKIRVPEEYKGIAIGTDGKNVKAAGKHFGRTIVVD